MMMIAIMAIMIGVINKASRSALSSDIDMRVINLLCYCTCYYYIEIRTNLELKYKYTLIERSCNCRYLLSGKEPNIRGSRP